MALKEAGRPNRLLFVRTPTLGHGAGLLQGWTRLDIPGRTPCSRGALARLFAFEPSSSFARQAREELIGWVSTNASSIVNPLSHLNPVSDLLQWWPVIRRTSSARVQSKLVSKQRRWSKITALMPTRPPLMATDCSNTLSGMIRCDLSVRHSQAFLRLRVFYTGGRRRYL